MAFLGANTLLTIFIGIDMSQSNFSFCLWGINFSHFFVLILHFQLSVSFSFYVVLWTGLNANELCCEQTLNLPGDQYSSTYAHENEINQLYQNL